MPLAIFECLHSVYDRRALRNWLRNQLVKWDAGGLNVRVPWPCRVESHAITLDRIRVQVWDRVSIHVRSNRRLALRFVANAYSEGVTAQPLTAKKKGKKVRQHPVRRTEGTEVFRRARFVTNVAVFLRTLRAGLSPVPTND